MADDKTEIIALSLKLGHPRLKAEAWAETAERNGELEKMRQRLLNRYNRSAGEIRRSAIKREQDQRADESRLRYSQERELVDATRANRRRTATLGQRLDDALARASAQSTVSAQRLDADIISGTATKSKPPPQQQGVMYEPSQSTAHEYYGRRFKLLLHSFEREVDATERRPLQGEGHGESGDEKDRRLVRDYKGWSAHEVAAYDRSLGSPLAVKRARIRLELRPNDGLPAEDELAHESSPSYSA